MHIGMQGKLFLLNDIGHSESFGFTFSENK